MKKKQNILLIIILLLCFILGVIIIISNKNITKETIKVKAMVESEKIENLQTQINNLNASHEEYAKNIQEYKTKIAEAITNQGVQTSADSGSDVIVKNIGKILSAKTTATATAARILMGETAWVNGSKIIGTMTNNGELNWNPSGSETYTLIEGYYSGGTLNSAEAYNAGIVDGREGYYTKEQYDANYTAGYNAGVTAGKNNATVIVKVWGVGGSSSEVGSRTYTLTYPSTGSYSQGDGDTKVSISWN